MEQDNTGYELMPYKVEGVEVPIMARFEEQTVWLSKAQIADLFKTTKLAVLYHINNIFLEKELTEEATTKEILVVQNEGNRQVSRKLPVYNLDMIISIGYRVNSKRAVQFRQWATAHLKNIMLKGYSVQAQQSAPREDLALQMVNVLQQTQTVMKLMGQKYQIALDVIEDLTPKADYCQKVLEAADCLTTSVIAKDLGMSAIALNQLLHELKVQYKQGEVWMLYADWQNLGLADYRSHHIESHNLVKQRMVWTQKGRAWIINMVEKGMTPREALKAVAPLLSPQGGKIGLGVEQMVLVFE